MSSSVVRKRRSLVVAAKMPYQCPACQEGVVAFWGRCVFLCFGLFGVQILFSKVFASDFSRFGVSAKGRLKFRLKYKYIRTHLPPLPIIRIHTCRSSFDAGPHSMCVYTRFLRYNFFIYVFRVFFPNSRQGSTNFIRKTKDKERAIA